MSSAKGLSSVDFTNFRNKELNGWEVQDYVMFELEEGSEDNYFLRTDRPYAHNGVHLEKEIKGLEVDSYYAFTISMRAVESEELIGVQVILGNHFPGAHKALEIELLGEDITPGKWQKIKGYIHKRYLTGTDQVEVNTYSFGKLDIDNILIDLAPKGSSKEGVPFAKKEPEES
ncbi:hypothetical protein [Pseudomonas sp. Teo4]|uniref:hypothetical protein n=1 Tax=Pseudomonas sp. Teo4 TaxID=3064528 RepID=UPI002ABA5851|nr:hypothetical protein [Pseudomonas sp. Teo4]MDZ3996253.1 hypothetical protein [Pseudomonas sp. Teo4]